jgi:hypothetical protein
MFRVVIISRRIIRNKIVKKYIDIRQGWYLTLTSREPLFNLQFEIFLYLIKNLIDDVYDNFNNIWVIPKWSVFIGGETEKLSNSFTNCRHSSWWLTAILLSKILSREIRWDRNMIQSSPPILNERPWMARR